jgi:hypothetical protein
MALPKFTEAQVYYRSAKQRLEDALVLERADRLTGAVYLGGYGIECILKAMILDILATRPRRAMLKEFRGGRAHSYDWLREQYVSKSGSRFPLEIHRDFLLAADWSTEYRYFSGSTSPGDAGAFLRAAQRIVRWADGRF